MTKNGQSEIGITAKIIAHILTFRNQFEQNFDVYAKPAYKENIYGADLDIFIETNPNRYRWIALQAKVLKSNKRYNTLRKPPGETQQWEKLKTLERISGCKGFYLLYNGMDIFNPILERDCCNRIFSDEQFGCSIVELDTISRLADITNEQGDFLSTHYNDIHPKLAEPWRVLVCCYLDKNVDNFRLYTKEEIEKDSKTFYPSKNDMEQRFTTSKEVDKFFASAINSPDFDNSISNARNEVKWFPDFKLVIHRTDNPLKEK